METPDGTLAFGFMLLPKKKKKVTNTRTGEEHRKVHAF